MRVPRGCDVALKATWHYHPGPRGVHIYIYIYIFISHRLYKRYSAFRISEGYSPLRTGAVYKPVDFLQFFPCGTKSHTVMLIAGHVELC